MPPTSTLFPYTTLFRSSHRPTGRAARSPPETPAASTTERPPWWSRRRRRQRRSASRRGRPSGGGDRKSTRLNSSHQIISYAVFCLTKKNDVETQDFEVA